MRIPVYRSDAQRTNEAPGRSFSARMDARPFVEAALQKGAATRALADAVGAYAEQRGKMIAEAEYNETALALDEEIRTATYDLSRSNDIGNIFDGNKLWEKKMKSIQSNVLGRVKNSNVRRKLDFSFNQSEIQSRFRLQGVVDDKIIKRDQAAIAARQTNAVAALSQIGATTADYNAWFNAQNPTMTEGGVKTGKFNPAAVSKANLAQRVDVAAGYVTNRYGAEPTSAMKLISFVNTLDEVEMSNVDEMLGVATLTTGIDPYAATVLSQIPRDQALKIVKDNLKTALAFYDAQEKLAGDLEQQNNKLNNDAYNLGFSAKPEMTYAQLAQVIPAQYLASKLKNIAPEGTKITDLSIPAKKAKEIIYNFLDEQNYLSPEKREKLNSQINISGALSFPETSVSGAYAKYNQSANFGRLTVEALRDAFNFRELSEADYITLENKIFTKNNENVNEFLRFAKATYNYTEEVAASTDEVSVAITAAYDAVAQGLIDFAIDNPAATALQIKTEGNSLIQDQTDAFNAAKREGYLRYLDNTKSSSGPGGRVPMDADDPIGSIRKFIRENKGSLDGNEELILLGRIRVLQSARFTGQFDLSISQ